MNEQQQFMLFARQHPVFSSQNQLATKPEQIIYVLVVFCKRLNVWRFQRNINTSTASPMALAKACGARMMRPLAFAKVVSMDES